jgi:hypothetical protein
MNRTLRIAITHYNGKTHANLLSADESRKSLEQDNKHDDFTLIKIVEIEVPTLEGRLIGNKAGWNALLALIEVQSIDFALEDLLSQFAIQLINAPEFKK